MDDDSIMTLDEWNAASAYAEAKATNASVAQAFQEAVEGMRKLLGSRVTDEEWEQMFPEGGS